MQQSRAVQQHRLVGPTFTLRVAEIATRVVCDEPGVALVVPPAARPFLVSDGAADVTITVERSHGLTAPRGEQLFDSGVVWRLYRDRDDFIFSFVSAALGPAPYCIARFDPSFSSGRVSVSRACLPDAAVLEPLQYPLDELVMINLLARGRGVEVHGCAVIDRDGGACLFAGQSGAGKSTIARLWHERGATILSDDRVILRLRAQKDDQVWIYGTPWHGDEAFANPSAAPLSRVFFLEHGPKNGARPARGAAAAARLFACSFPPFHDVAGLHFTVGLLARIVERVPCFELTFVPEPSVIDFARDAS